MTTYYLNDYGFIQPFQVLLADGITPYDLTGVAVTWLFSDNTVSPATKKTLSGTVTDAPNGKCQFTPGSGFFNTVTKYNCQLQLSTGALTLHTDPVFIVEILSSEN